MEKDVAVREWCYNAAAQTLREYLKEGTPAGEVAQQIVKSARQIEAYITKG